VVTIKKIRIKIARRCSEIYAEISDQKAEKICEHKPTPTKPKPLALFKRF